MASFAIRSGKGVKSVPTPSSHAEFVLGSRPNGVRAPKPPTIRPAPPSTRDYGKTPEQPPFGNTSLTMRS